MRSVTRSRESGAETATRGRRGVVVVEEVVILEGLGSGATVGRVVGGAKKSGLDALEDLEGLEDLEEGSEENDVDARDEEGRFKFGSDADAEVNDRCVSCSLLPTRRRLLGRDGRGDGGGEMATISGDELRGEESIASRLRISHTRYVQVVLSVRVHKV